jgi:hypothetical protein
MCGNCKRTETGRGEIGLPYMSIYVCVFVWKKKEDVFAYLA